MKSGKDRLLGEAELTVDPLQGIPVQNGSLFTQEDEGEISESKQPVVLSKEA